MALAAGRGGGERRRGPPHIVERLRIYPHRVRGTGRAGGGGQRPAAEQDNNNNREARQEEEVGEGRGEVQPQRVEAGAPAGAEPLLQPQRRVVAGLVGEQEDITAFLNPDLPEAGPVTVDVDGWGRIDGLSAWQCTLAGFNATRKVPLVHKEKWVRAVSSVLRRIQEATTEQELTRYLKWRLILPQVLLRQAQRNGKKGQGARMVNGRFQAMVEGDWGKLLVMLEKDREANERAAAARTRGRQQQEEDMEKKREVVLDLVARGQVGRVAARIKSHSVASIDTPGVMEALRTKFPARMRPLPATATKGQIVDNLGGLKEALVALELGSVPGTGGMRPEFLVTLGKKMSEEDMGRMEEHGMAYLNGVYHPLQDKPEAGG